MKKIVFLMVLVLLASCAEEITVIDGSFTLTVNATKESREALTKALTSCVNPETGKNTVTATWSVGDVVTVYNETKGADLSGTLTAQSEGASTTLTGTLTGLIEVGDALKLKYSSPNYDQQNGTLTGFDKSLDKQGDYAEATVTVAQMNGGDVTATTSANFVNQQAIVRFYLKDKSQTQGDQLINATKLKVNDGTHTYTLIPPYASAMLFVALPGMTDQTLTLTAYKGDKRYSYEKADVTFVNGQYYEITVWMSPVPTPTGALPGLFSIAEGHRVFFSQGNLQYRATTGTWRFAEHQQDCIGESNQYIGETYDGWIDLFGWASSGYSNQPYDNRTYWGAYGPEDTEYHLYEYVGLADWGTNAISNGGNTSSSGWFTMRPGQWDYLLNTRDTRCATITLGGTRYTWAQVFFDEDNFFFGLILFPDDPLVPLPDNEQGVQWGVINSMEGADQNYTVCSAGGWSALEAAGCVFLPGAGLRHLSTVKGVQYNGYYWTSERIRGMQPVEEGGQTVYKNVAYYMHFHQWGLETNASADVSGGFSVRLVRNFE